MLYIDNTYTDVYFNLAAEEYLLKNFAENIFMIWQNSPAVVIGKHQDVFAEVNLDFARDNGITVARRYSGGGAVFQDEGNLNITFIETTRNDIDFDNYLRLIEEALSGIGLNPVKNDRRSLFLSGRKISGSAQSVYRDRILFHATLLFDSDLNKLEKVLQADQTHSRPDEKKISVPSERSQVDNIRRYLGTTVDIQCFRKFILNQILRHKPGYDPYQWNEEDMKKIESIKQGKYETTRWNMGVQCSEPEIRK